METSLAKDDFMTPAQTFVTLEVSMTTLEDALPGFL